MGHRTNQSQRQRRAPLRPARKLKTKGERTNSVDPLVQGQISAEMIGSSHPFQEAAGAAYVYFPLPLAAAIGLEAGEEVQWELLDRGELHLVRNQLPQVQATQRATQRAEIPLPSQKT